MRLINVQDEHRMFFEEFYEPKIPEYTILSHTWEGEEISYVETCAILSGSGASYVYLKAGFQKLMQFATVARKLGVDYIWMDTLQSFRRPSTACIVGTATPLVAAYILPTFQTPSVKYFLPAAERKKMSQAVKDSRWLTRGWTLQELLAPRKRFFYSRNWEAITNDTFLDRPISEETGIQLEAIRDFKSERWSIAQKMSWAARRQTTRVEDRAYSLLGIFNVNMPLIYGEGESAFRRLQEEILKHSIDQTVFCWKSTNANYATWRGLFARSPSEFADSGDILENKRANALPFQLTNKGIQLSLELVPRKWELIAFLQCYHAQSARQYGIYLQRTHDDNYVRVDPDKLAEEVPDPLVRNKTKILETVFAKAEVTGSTWRKSDMCSRIAGFRFPSNYNGLLDRPWNLIVRELTGTTPPHQCWEKEGTFSFDFEGQISTIARCRLGSTRLFSGCSIETLMKYDCRKKYGEGDDRVERSSKNNDTTNSDWVQSECCEWKMEGSSCNMFEISVTSWIELDDESDARIHVQFSDTGDHDVCVEEWESSEDAV